MQTITAERPRDQAPEGRADMADLAPYATDRSIADLGFDPKAVELTWDDGRRSRFHAVWLRDNCPCPACRHPQAMERQYLLVEAVGPPAVADAALSPAGDLRVTFAPDGPGGPPHVGLFHAGWLRQNSYADWARAERRQPRQLWDATLARDIPTVDYAAMMTTDEGLERWLDLLLRYGLVRLQGVPPVPGEGVRVANRIGPVRPTNFGEVFDVISMPNPNASAYTPIGLEPHTDLANWRWPPDYQLLFCVANEAEGGGSILVDGFRAAEAVRRADPAAFALLTRQEIDFRFHDDDCDIRHRAPSIALDASGEIVAIRFNNWLRATLQVPEEDVEATYAALLVLWRQLRDPALQLRLRLGPGDLVTFDNARVLHGRDPFDPRTGRRHLQGCYLDRDTVLSRRRLLQRQAASRAG